MNKFQSSWKNALRLAGFAFCCTLLVAAVNWLTRPLIAQQLVKQTQKSIQEVIPEQLDLAQLDMLCLAYTDKEALGTEQAQMIRWIIDQDQVLATVYAAIAPDGYSGDIKLLVGINSDNSISGVRVIEHRETPGLGDKIETRKSDWILSFNQQQWLGEQDRRWAVSKDGGHFASFTGATITPRSVVKAVKKVLQLHHRQMLFDQASACSEVKE